MRSYPVSMPVRIDPPAVARTRSRVIAAVNHGWVEDMLALGLDGPVPPGRPRPSDWNQHVPEIEADGAAWDDFVAQVNEALGIR